MTLQSGKVTSGGKAMESCEIMTVSFILMLAQTEKLLNKNGWILISNYQLSDLDQ